MLIYGVKVGSLEGCRKPRYGYMKLPYTLDHISLNLCRTIELYEHFYFYTFKYGLKHSSYILQQILNITRGYHTIISTIFRQPIYVRSSGSRDGSSCFCRQALGMKEAPGKFSRLWLHLSPSFLHLFLFPLSEPIIYPGLYFSLLLIILISLFLAMQRALSTRTSVLSAASKRAPFSRSTLNLQQQRFAHKVRWIANYPQHRLAVSLGPCSVHSESVKSFPLLTATRRSSSALKLVPAFSRVLTLLLRLSLPHSVPRAAMC